MAFDCFMKIDGVPGESRDDKHRNEIDVLSFSFGVAPGEKKVPAVQDFQVVKFFDKASPVLFVAACQGEHLKDAVLTCRKAGGDQQEFLIIVLKDVLVSSIRPGGSAGGETSVPLEEVSFNYASIEIEYHPQKQDGSLGSPVQGFCNVSAHKKS